MAIGGFRVSKLTTQFTINKVFPSQIHFWNHYASNNSNCCTISCNGQEMKKTLGCLANQRLHKPKIPSSERIIRHAICIYIYKYIKKNGIYMHIIRVISIVTHVLKHNSASNSNQHCTTGSFCQLWSHLTWESCPMTCRNLWMSHCGC